MNYRTCKAVFIKSNQSQYWIQNFQATNQNTGFKFMFGLPKISGMSIVVLLCYAMLYPITSLWVTTDKAEKLCKESLLFMAIHNKACCDNCQDQIISKS